MTTRGPDMPTQDRILIREFLAQVLVRAQHLTHVEAQVQAGYLLSFVLALDGEGLGQVAALCNEADHWGHEWRKTSVEVRQAISRYHQVRMGLGDSSTLDANLMSALSEGEAQAAFLEELEDHEARFAQLDESVKAEIDDLDMLDRWLEQTERPLSEFFDLWESADEGE